MSKLLSVITVCLNSEQTIKKCLYSCPDLEGVEHIVVDGNSNDKTIEIIESVLIDKPHLTLVREKKANGIFNALNFGISLAKGKYILILHSDDELVNFGQLIDEIKLEHSDIIVGRQIGLIGENHIITIGFKKIFDGPVIKMPWPHGSMVIKKQFFDSVGNYDTKYKMSSDLDWVNNALICSPRIKYIDFDISKFSFGGISTTSLSGPLESYKIFRSHGGKFLVGVLTLLKALTIKLLARSIGWHNIFRLKKILKLRTGIWHS